MGGRRGIYQLWNYTRLRHPDAQFLPSDIFISESQLQSLSH